MHDVTNIWQVPLLLQQQNTHKLLLDHLHLPHADKLNLHRWRTTLADRWDNLAAEVQFPPLTLPGMQALSCQATCLEMQAAPCRAELPGREAFAAAGACAGLAMQRNADARWSRTAPAVRLLMAQDA